MTQEEFSAVCPYLGLADDADSHATYATEAHRCYRLANPTRIAAPHQESYCLGANHVTCPVYLGEGVPGAQQRAPRPQAAMPPPEAPTVRGPRTGSESGGRQPFGGGGRGPAAPTGAQRPARRQPSPGTLGPRPRSGGVSMPVATIGLFALAVVVIVLAFAIQQMVGDNGGDSQAPADAVATRDALNRTRTAQAGTSDTTPTTPTTPTTQTPGNQTTGTPATGTATTPSPGGTNGAGTRYTVQDGDSCFAIAEANDITLQELLDANDLTEDDCTRLNVGDELIIP